MRIGTIQEWEKFKRCYSAEQLKSLENNAELQSALKNEDFVQAQEIANAVMLGNLENHYPSWVDKFLNSN